MATIFSRIVAGEIPCYKVGENEKFFAFLDINPLTKGHTLVIPKQEVDYLYDLDDDTLQGMILFAKQIAQKIKAFSGCTKVATVVLGLEVPHAHIHLLPINSESDMNFFAEKKQLQPEEMKAIAEKIFNKFNENKTSHPEIF